MGAAAIPAAVGVGASAFSYYERGQAGKAESNYYSYLADTANLNSRIADASATAEKRGIGVELADKERQLTNRISETVGVQKAAVVGGVGASSRSAQDIISDTLDKGNLDEMALRLNADMRANNVDIERDTRKMNLDAQAGGYRIAGQNALTASKGAQVTSLLSGAGSVANSWYQGRKYYSRNGTIGSIE